MVNGKNSLQNTKEWLDHEVKLREMGKQYDSSCLIINSILSCRESNLLSQNIKLIILGTL